MIVRALFRGSFYILYKIEEDPFAKKAQNLNKIFHEIVSKTKVGPTKLQGKSMNNIYFDL